ncbi:hypothetical protein QCA50_013915 [Cerrena zonata]|uniref:Amino acid permease/ SLC12A domain-containing protein n=1 Tax=Cerrena zonata TaxID=2478898 RepID=A0AAW0FMK0_9APHY
MKDNKDFYSFNVSEGADDSISVANSRIVSFDEKTGEKIENESEEKLHRGMKSRHLALISLSGAIGTGLFVGSGASLAATGPGPLLLGYIFLSELIVAGASEVERPRRNIKKAANSFIYRLAFFYIFGSLIIGIIADSRSPELLNTSGNASASPFVLGIQNAGIPVLNQIINAVVLTSAASAGSSFLYAASRSLFSLSKRGLAPKIFAKTNRYQVPYVAVLANSCVTCLAYLNVSSTSAQVFTWLSNISTISGFIAWVGVAFAYIRWRKAIVVHNLSDRVPLRTPLQPYGAYIVIVFISLLTLTNGYAVFFDFNVADFFAAYVTFIFVFVLYLGRRLYSYFIKGEKRWLTPLEEVSFEGLDEFEAEDASYPEVVPRNLAEKAWLIIV